MRFSLRMEKLIFYTCFRGNFYLFYGVGLIILFYLVPIDNIIYKIAVFIVFNLLISMLPDMLESSIKIDINNKYKRFSIR